jgi:hypothetical protein
LEFVVRFLFPALPHDLISRMVKFNSQLVREVGDLRLWGQRGAPWELNLRDLCRWCEATIADSSRCAPSERSVTFNPGKFVELIYVDRMRTKEDREKASCGTCCPILNTEEGAGSSESFFPCARLHVISKTRCQSCAFLTYFSFLCSRLKNATFRTLAQSTHYFAVFLRFT